MTKRLHTALYWQEVAAESHFKMRLSMALASTKKQGPARRQHLDTAVWHQQHADAAARIARLALGIEP